MVSQSQIAKVLVQYLSFLEAFGIIQTGIEEASFSPEGLERTSKPAILLKETYIKAFPA